METSVRRVEPVKPFRLPGTTVASHQVIYGAPAQGMPLPPDQAPSFLRVLPLRAAVHPTLMAPMVTDHSDLSSRAPQSEPPAAAPQTPAAMAFESTYVSSARGDRAQLVAMHPSSSIQSASVGVCADYADAGGGSWMPAPSMSFSDLLPPMDFVFYKDPNFSVPIIEDTPAAPPWPPPPAEPVPEWKSTRDISVKADSSHAQSFQQLASQIQDLTGSQQRLNMELQELKQQVYCTCQDLEIIRRESQKKLVGPSSLYSDAPRLSPPPVLLTRQPPVDLEDNLNDLPVPSPKSTSMSTKNLGYESTQDILSSVRGHAARGLSTLHRHTSRAVQNFSDSSWLASMGQGSTRIS